MDLLLRRWGSYNYIRGIKLYAIILHKLFLLTFNQTTLLINRDWHTIYNYPFSSILSVTMLIKVILRPPSIFVVWHWVDHCLVFWLIDMVENVLLDLHCFHPVLLVWPYLSFDRILLMLYWDSFWGSYYR